MTCGNSKSAIQLFPYMIRVYLGVAISASVDDIELVNLRGAILDGRSAIHDILTAHTEEDKVRQEPQGVPKHQVLVLFHELVHVRRADE